MAANSNLPPKTLPNQLSESGGINCYSSSLHCSDIAPAKSASYCKRSNLDLASDFPEHIDIYGRKSERFGNRRKPRISEGTKYVEAIPAVPLRSLPCNDAKWDLGKSVTYRDEDDVVGHKMASNTKNTARQQEDSWEHESKKLAAIIAEAREFINILDGKYFTSKDFQVIQQKDFGMETSGEDSEDEVSVLSPAEWNMVPKFCKGDAAKDSMGEVEEKLEKWSSNKSRVKFWNMVEPQGTKIVESVALYSDFGLNQQSEMVPDCELEAKRGGEQEEHNVMDSEPKYCENHKELINLEMMQNEHRQCSKVLETLKLFEEQYVELSKERKLELREGKIPQWTYVHVGAAERVKEMGKCMSLVKPFGHIPGVAIGDKFRFRAELAVVGLHCQPVSGIDFVDVKGKKCATSVVDSGRYGNMAKSDGVLIYSGQGGNPKLNENASDQTLKRGNGALVNSMEMGFPIRVIFKRKNLLGCKTLCTSNEQKFVYVYDGLYIVNNYWQEREEHGGKLVYKFELHRLSCQPKALEINAKRGKPIKRKRLCVLDDVSQGKEKFCVRALNGEDDDLPRPFTYTTEIVYPDWFKRIEPIGCDCTNGCSDSQECPCLLKNDGEIPFNEKGAIIRAKPRVYECGPSCKCPPTCMNRVTQHGPHHKLEIFKTESRGWGLRSRGFISSGSFICEYVGELLQDREAEQRFYNDDYLFDICDSGDEADQVKSKEGFALDAAVYGNIGRFINHSCSPNLYAQEVFYDHDDKRMPHIMFFAKKDIPRRRELTYNYNYEIGGVCDVNGNIKSKACYCGSPKCTGRMY